MEPYIAQIVCNIIGGALVAILIWISLGLIKQFHKRSFKGVFGKDSAERFFIIYGNLKHRDCFEKNGKPMEWPYHKPGVGGVFKAFSVTSLAEMRSAKYLSGTFGKIMNTVPELISDDEKKDRLDISFCSLGGLNNFKTNDILNSSENKFFSLYFNKIVVKGNQGKEFYMHNNYDYGLIIKIIPKSFLDKVWIAAAGLGEWGTSGAAWFLSKNWNRLPKNKSFGLIIRTKGGRDESAEVIYQI